MTTKHSQHGTASLLHRLHSFIFFQLSAVSDTWQSVSLCWPCFWSCDSSNACCLPTPGYGQSHAWKKMFKLPCSASRSTSFCSTPQHTCAMAGESSPMPSRPQPKCTCSRVRGVCMSPFALASFVVRIKFARCPLEAVTCQRNQRNQLSNERQLWVGKTLKTARFMPGPAWTSLGCFYYCFWKKQKNCNRGVFSWTMWTMCNTNYSTVTQPVRWYRQYSSIRVAVQQ